MFASLSISTLFSRMLIRLSYPQGYLVNWFKSVIFPIFPIGCCLRHGIPVQIDWLFVSMLCLVVHDLPLPLSIKSKTMKYCALKAMHYCYMIRIIKIRLIHPRQKASSRLNYNPCGWSSFTTTSRCRQYNACEEWQFQLDVDFAEYSWRLAYSWSNTLSRFRQHFPDT